MRKDLKERDKSLRQRGSILMWVVGGIWILVLVGAGGILASSMFGFTDAGFFPASIPTVPSLDIPAPPATESPSSAATADIPTPTTVSPVFEPAHMEPPATDEPPEESGLGYQFEATFTPLIPVTPSPTAFLTPMPFSEGPIPIGTSVAGRPIQVVRFGVGPVGRMIVAGIHGGYEWNTVDLADALIAYVEEHPEVIPQRVTLYILRVLNPDGLARLLWAGGRANENGVDLNRNFPVNWRPEWSREGCWDYLPTTGGTGPGSEPETQALMAFLKSHHITALISYHSAALGIFPAAVEGNVGKHHPPSVRLAEAIAEESTYPYPPVDTGCIYTGSLPDFAATVGTAAVDVELHTHESIDLEENLQILEVFLNWRR